MSKKILIIEDERGLSDMYKMKFEKEGYVVLVAYDGMSGIELAKQERPDLILLDIIMPGIDGFEVLRTLRATPETMDTKIFVFSNLGQDDEIERGLQEGADKYLIKANLTPGQLLTKIEEAFDPGKKKDLKGKNQSSIASLKKRIEGNVPRILLIEDENDIIAMYDLYLSQEGFDVCIARNGAWGLKQAREKQFDLIIMDMVMPAMNGLQLLQHIKKEALHPGVPILVLSNSAQDNDIAKAKEEGATAYLLKSTMTPASLVKEIKKYLK